MNRIDLQKGDEFYGVILCFVNQRYLYLSSPISKLHDRLYSSLRQATKVTNLKDLNGQILTSQNIPVIVDRFLNFIFEHGLMTKGKMGENKILFDMCRVKDQSAS